MPCAKEPPLSEELQEQLALLENSQGLIRAVLLGVAMQYKALDLQKCLLLESARDAQTVDTASCPDPKAIQIAASLIVLYALFGFQKQAEGIACQTAQAGGCTDWTEPKLNATVILVALIRLCRLAASGNTAASEDTAAGQRIATLEAEETSAEPVV